MRTKNPAMFYGAIVLAIVFLLVCVYYILPGYYHVLSTHDFTKPQLKHALLFGVLAILAILAALVTRPKSTV